MNLSYETLQKLKDAQFPKSEFRCVQDIEPVAWVGIPTLSELIEAVRTEDQYFYLASRPGGWVAMIKLALNSEFSANGETPESAVASLYLALYPQPLLERK